VEGEHPVLKLNAIAPVVSGLAVSEE